MESADAIAGTSAPAAPQELPEYLDNSASILAPILVGYRTVTPGSTIAPIMTTICESIPAERVMRKVLVGRNAVALPHRRAINYLLDNDRPAYKILVRCIDVGPDLTVSQAFNSWLWEIGLVIFKQGTAPELLPPECNEQVRLDVTRYRMQNKGVICAKQLALVRHLFVQSVLAVDEKACVFGGAHGWRREWWPNPDGSML